MGLSDLETFPDQNGFTLEVKMLSFIQPSQFLQVPAFLKACAPNLVHFNKKQGI